MGINLPNGAEVGEIVLPDGSQASEVIGPDGSTVWERVAIPDTEVCRDPDNTSNQSTNPVGLKFAISEDWNSEMGFRLSDEVSGFSRARLFEDPDGDNKLIVSKDISDLSQSDTFTLEFDILDSDKDYSIVVGAEGDEYTQGQLDPSDFPYEDEDGILSITGAVLDDGSDISAASNIDCLGNIR